MITHAALAAALVATLIPAAPADSTLGPRLLRNRNSGLCLTCGTEIATGKTIAALGNCDPRSKYTLWKRTGRSHLANGSMCLSGPSRRGEMHRVLVRRCSSGLKAQRLTITKIRWAMEGDHYEVRWKSGAPGMCLAGNLKGQVYPDHCRPRDTDTEWVLVRWGSD